MTPSTPQPDVPPDPAARLEAEKSDLRRRLEDAEQTIHAIRHGEVDAFVVKAKEGDRVYSLRGADQAYQAFVEHMRDGAATVAADGTILYCNARLSTLLGEPLGRLLGTNLIDHVSPDDGYMAEALLRRGERRDSRGDVTFITSTGQMVATYLTVFPIELEDVQAACVMVQDLTEINRYKDELDRLVEMRTSELDRENMSLREVSDSKNKIIARLCDELDRPLQTLSAVLEHARQESSPQAAQIASDDVQAMESATLRLAGLLQDMRTLADIESGNARLEYGRVHVRSLAVQAASDVETAAREKGVEVLVDAPHDDMAFVGDAVKIDRIVRTLLYFAVESVTEGPVRLSAAVTPDLFARFVVSVPGEPLPARDVRLLAEGVLAPESTDAVDEKASALSLWTASRIAQFLRGELQISMTGDSTSFVFTVPV